MSESVFSRGEEVHMTVRDNGELASGNYLTADEAASMLRTTRKAVYALIEKGVMPGIRRIGRRVLVRRRALIEWIEGGSRGAR